MLWIVIRTLDDLRPFLGQVVCLKSKCSYFTRGREQIFGIVSTEIRHWMNDDIDLGEGPNFEPFLTPSESERNCALMPDGSGLTTSGLSVEVALRGILPEEKVLLQRKYKSGQLRLMWYRDGLPKELE
jgi:hypothetical protein